MTQSKNHLDRNSNFNSFVVLGSFQRRVLECIITFGLLIWFAKCFIAHEVIIEMLLKNKYSL